MKRFLSALLAVLALSGCARSAAPHFHIDNPTDASMTLNIDGQDHPVPAHGSTEVTLAPGEHRLRSDRLGEVRFIVYADGPGGIINPTLSDYVIAREIYVTDDSKLKNFHSFSSLIDLGGVVFEGAFRQTHDLFIDKDWTFGVGEPFPEQQTVLHVNESGGRINSKIFRAREFIAYFEASNDLAGAYAREQPGGYIQPEHPLETAPADLPPLHPEFEAHAAALRDIYARHLKAVSAEEQRELRKQNFQAQMAFTSATAMLGSTLPAEANQAYNNFVQTRSALMGRTALVVP